MYRLDGQVVLNHFMYKKRVDNTRINKKRAHKNQIQDKLDRPDGIPKHLNKYTYVTQNF